MTFLRRSKRYWAFSTEDGILIGKNATVARKVRGGQLLTELFEAIDAHLKNGDDPPTDQPECTVESLQEALKKEFPSALVSDAVNKFIKLGIIEVSESLDPPADGQPEGEETKDQSTRFSTHPLYNYFSEQVSRPNQAMEKFTSSQVIIFGQGQLLNQVISHLESADVTTVTVPATRLAARLAARLTARLTAPTSAASQEEDYQALIEDITTGRTNSNLLVAVADNPLEKMRLFPQINALSLKLNKPLLTGYLNGEEVILGPLFIPGETGCYHCLELREESQLPQPNELKSLKAYVQSRWQPFSGQVHPFAPTFLASSLALEIVRILSRVSFPSTYQTLISFDLATFESQPHTLLKVPLCDVCGPHVKSPFRKIWDI